MRLYFRDTKMMYREIRELLNSHIGPTGPETWQNGGEYEYPKSKSGEFRGYVEIYNDHPGAVFVKLKW